MAQNAPRDMGCRTDVVATSLETEGLAPRSQPHHRDDVADQRGALVSVDLERDRPPVAGLAHACVRRGPGTQGLGKDEAGAVEWFFEHYGTERVVAGRAVHALTWVEAAHMSTPDRSIELWALQTPRLGPCRRRR